MKQDDFNKILTSVLMAFFMLMLWLSWYYGKPIDIAGIVAFLVPMLTHTVHIITRERQLEKKKNNPPTSPGP